MKRFQIPSTWQKLTHQSIMGRLTPVKYHSCVPEVALVMSDSLRPNGLYPARVLCPWNLPGKNTGVGYRPSSRDLPNPGSNPCLLHRLYQQVGTLPLVPHLWKITTMRDARKKGLVLRITMMTRLSTLAEVLTSWKLIEKLVKTQMMPL